jgi:hypothetical protein
VREVEVVNFYCRWCGFVMWVMIQGITAAGKVRELLAHFLHVYRRS